MKGGDYRVRLRVDVIKGLVLSAIVLIVLLTPFACEGVWT